MVELSSKTARLEPPTVYESKVINYGKNTNCTLEWTHDYAVHREISFYRVSIEILIVSKQAFTQSS